MSDDLPLQEIYRQRFNDKIAYRQRVWQAIIDSYLAPIIGPVDQVLDLGCGYGEFINQFPARQRFGMDLNTDSRDRVAPGVHFIQHDCSQPWPLPKSSLDLVFTSNFFEHLPDKAALQRTLQHISVALKPGGKLVAIGPNIKCEPGRYWDICDHFLPLTESSLAEFCRLQKFIVEREVERFVPWTMASNRRYPIFMVHTYMKLPWLWRIFGRQFLVVARKPADS